MHGKGHPLRSSTLLPLLALALALWGCEGSTSNSGDRSGGSITGSVSKRLAGAAVCLDLNRNFACDPGEPDGTVDAAGEYAVSVSETVEAGDAPVILIQEPAGDPESGTRSGPVVLSSVPGGPRHLSLLTTLMAAGGLGQQQLKEALAFDASEDLFAPAAPGSESEAFERSFLGLYTTLCEKYAGQGDPAPHRQAASELMTHGQKLGGAVDAVLAAPTPSMTEPPQAVAVGDDIYTDVPMLKSGYLFGDAIDEVNFDTIDNPGCLDAIPATKDAQDVSTFDYYFQVIQDKKDLVRSMDLNASLSLNLEEISGSAQGEYLNDVESHTNDVYALIAIKAKTVKFEINGMQLAGIADVPANYFPACSSDVDHYGDLLYTYLCRYDDFAKLCGNRFVKAVTAGGTYYGLMHIQANDQASRRDIMVDLQGSFDDGVIDGSVKGDFKSHVDSIASKYSATFRVRTTGPAFDLSSLSAAGKANGDPDPYLIDSAEKFFQYGDIFVEQVLNKDGPCYGPDAYKTCAVSVDFADYQSVARWVRDAQTEERKNVTQTLLSDYEGLQSYSRFMEDIIAHQGDYNWSYHAMVPSWDANGEPKAPYAWKAVSIDPDAFWDTYSYTLGFLGTLQNEYTSCLGGGSECSPIALPYTIAQLQYMMPVAKRIVPRSCDDWLGWRGGMGNYIEVQADAGGNVMVGAVCELADANHALTYLDITSNRSGSPDSPSVNYSRWEAADGAVVTTIFDQLRIHPNIGRVQLLNNQSGQTQTGVVGGVLDPATNRRDPTEPTAAELLRALDCDPDDTPSVVNIDLSGTALKFADGLEFQASVATRYEISDSARTWADAKADAESKGGHLVEIDSADEFAAIAGMFGSSAFDSVWMGLSTDAADVTLKSQYQWQSDERPYSVAAIGMDVWGASFPQTTCTPVVPPSPTPQPPPPAPEPPPYVFPPYHPRPYPLKNPPVFYRAAADVAQTCDETRRCAAADRQFGWGLTNVNCTGERFYLIEYPPAPVPYTATLSADRKTLDLSVKDTTDDGKCVEVTPQGPVWLVPDVNP